MITITISKCNVGGRSWQHTARTVDMEVAVQRAVRRHWGQRAWFAQDSGLQRGYGQIMRDVGGGGASAATGCVKILVDGTPMAWV